MEIQGAHASLLSSPPPAQNHYGHRVSVFAGFREKDYDGNPIVVVVLCVPRASVLFFFFYLIRRKVDNILLYAKRCGPIRRRSDTPERSKREELIFIELRETSTSTFRYHC